MCNSRTHKKNLILLSMLYAYIHSLSHTQKKPTQNCEHKGMIKCVERQQQNEEYITLER